MIESLLHQRIRVVMKRPGPPRDAPFRCSDCLSRAAGIFRELDRGGLDELDRARVSRRMTKGDRLYSQGDLSGGFYCLRVGRLKVFRTRPHGQEYILRIVEPGQVLGLETLASDRIATSSAEMVEDGIVCRTDRDFVLDLVKRDPSTAARVIETLAEQLGASDDQRFAMASLSVRERTARLLALFVQSHGKPDRNGLVLRLPVTRQTLAQLVAAAPETVMRTLQKLRDEKIIQGRGKTLHVPDLDRLLDAAGLGPKGQHSPDD